MKNKNDYEFQSTSNKAITIKVNNKGEYISINPDDATLFDRFTAGYKRITELATEAHNKMEEIGKKYEGKDDYDSAINYATEMAKENVYFSEESVKILDGIFGADAIKKYFRNIYDEIPDFLPGVECIYEFLETATPVLEDIFDRQMEDTKKRRKARMEKYKPVDYKK